MEFISSSEVKAAARVVAEQALAIGTGVPLDPALADAMGAYREDAFGLADMMEDALLTDRSEGGATYGGE
jgi:hypothetical protein